MTRRPAPMHLTPVIAVGDLERARGFYEGKLGLDGSASAGGGWRVGADHGTSATLLPGDPSAGAASWPVATFLVPDVTAVVRELRARGVTFLGPDDVPFALDAEGISNDQDGLRVAWMRDPDGNVLTVYSEQG